MSSKQYREALQRLKLTQAHAAWLFNGKSRASGRRWAQEGAPYHVALLLTIMRERHISAKAVEHYGAQWRKEK